MTKRVKACLTGFVRAQRIRLTIGNNQWYSCYFSLRDTVINMLLSHSGQSGLIVLPIRF